MLASIPSPSDGTINIGPLPIHAYGLLAAVAVLVAAKIAEVRWVRRGYSSEDFGTVVIWVVIAGVVGSRVYHLFTGYDWDRNGIAGTFKIWEGGLGAPGWITGGIIAVLVVARVRHLEPLVLLDCIAVAVPAGHAIGRWGNWFNQELFGRPTDLPWALEIDRANRPPEYINDSTFHPTFLYESIYLLALFGFLLWAEHRFRLRKGQVTALYIAGYSFGRFFVENLRIDPAQHIAGLRINAWVSALAFLGATAWFIWLGRNGRPYPPSDTAAAPSESPAERPA